MLPNYHSGDPSEEGELLTWLLYQMKEDTIENINRDLLFKMIAEEEFLGVFFCEYQPDFPEEEIGCQIKWIKSLNLIRQTQRPNSVADSDQ